MKHNFDFSTGRTQIVHLFNGETPEIIMELCRTGAADGADGLCVELGTLAPEFRTVENYRKIVESVPLPMLFNCYRNDIVPGSNDDSRAEELVKAAQAGAGMVDIMGDQFDPSPEEHTTDAKAIARQKELAQTLHRLGAQVEISSHTKCFLEAEEIVRRLQEFDERGADLLKIVTTADTEEEYIESLRGTMLARKTLKKPFIHLCGGKFARLHRLNGILLGIAATFAVHEPGGLYGMQPRIRTAKTFQQSAKDYLG